MSKILFIDNHDSFTYNVIQSLRVLGAEIILYQNHDLQLPIKRSWDAIVISPGPGHPKDAGISVPLIKDYHGTCPILGICLGHQAIAYAFGGNVDHAAEVIHGHNTWITHTGTGLFAGMTSPFLVGRYHSLSIHTLPDGFFSDAHSKDATIMSIRHHKHPTFGLQFHPESILTPMGMHIIHNFLQMI